MTKNYFVVKLAHFNIFVWICLQPSERQEGWGGGGGGGGGDDKVVQDCENIYSPFCWFPFGKFQNGWNSSLSSPSFFLVPPSLLLLILHCFLSSIFFCQQKYKQERNMKQKPNIVIRKTERDIESGSRNWRINWERNIKKVRMWLEREDMERYLKRLGKRAR